MHNISENDANIRERISKLEQGKIDGNGWVRRVEDTVEKSEKRIWSKIDSIEKRIWELLITEIGVIVGLIALIISTIWRS